MICNHLMRVMDGPSLIYRRSLIAPRTSLITGLPKFNYPPQQIFGAMEL